MFAITSLSQVTAAQWDALCPPDSPFLEHRFLYGLELSESVGRQAGWMPLYLLVVEDTAIPDDPADALDPGAELLGAAPCYVKTNSYGEFIFDWQWADAFYQLGRRYYPKLVIATPFTPVTGQRILLAEHAPEETFAALADGARALAEQFSASSVHWLFTQQAEAQGLVERGYIHRLSHQNHWIDQDYGDFEGFLAPMRSRARKQIRAERRKGQAHGLELMVLRGDEMSDDAWQAIGRLYRKGCHRYGSAGYLTDAFFEHLQSEMPERVVCSLARDAGLSGPEQWVAGTLNFQKGDALYGRYWGCDREYDHLHFELAFYQLIEACLARGWRRFEAGAGGDHKVRRGLSPKLCHSAHWIADEELHAAVDQWVSREKEHTERYTEALVLRGTGHRPHHGNSGYDPKSSQS